MSSSYNLGKHYEGLVRDLVRSGRYSSPSEVMRDGLRLLEERESQRTAKLEVLRAAIRDGLDSGPREPLDMDEIKAEARRRKAEADPSGRDAQHPSFAARTPRSP